VAAKQFSASIISSAILSSAILLGHTTEAFADWPEFRGPNQNGQSQTNDLPTQWSETENIKWFSKTEGLGWSSPAIVGNTIYFTSAMNADSSASDPSDLQGNQKLMLVAIRADTGLPLFSKVVFEQPKDAPKIHNKNSHASASPLIRGDRIFVHFGHQGTACFDLRGNKQWENRDHAFPPTHGNGGSPILVGDLLILTCDGGDEPYTLALNAETGKQVWKTPRGVEVDRKFSFCTPQLIEVNGVSLVISPGSNVVQALSSKDGSVAWFVRYDGFSVVPRPLFHQGILYVCTGFMATKLLAIDPSGTGDVTASHVKWIYGSGVPQTPSLVALGDRIVMVSDSGIATGVSTATGTEVWRKRLGGNYSASPLLAGSRAYFQGELGECIVYDLSGEPKEVARNKLPGRIFASYAIADNDLVIRSEEGLYRIGKP
jgi:outer membrane protein assembly factor BamB